jgi:hypothetical protein
VCAGPPDSGGGGKTARSLLPAGEAADGGEGAPSWAAGRARGKRGGPLWEREGAGPLFISFLFIYLFIYFLFPLSFVSIPSDLISSSSTPSQMRRIHSKQNRQSKEICTPT